MFKAEDNPNFYGNYYYRNNFHKDEGNYYNKKSFQQDIFSELPQS